MVALRVVLSAAGVERQVPDAHPEPVACAAIAVLVVVRYARVV
jgi:hypothetical protein